MERAVGTLTILNEYLMSGSTYEQWHLRMPTASYWARCSCSQGLTTSIPTRLLAKGNMWDSTGSASSRCGE